MSGQTTNQDVVRRGTIKREPKDIDGFLVEADPGIPSNQLRRVVVAVKRSGIEVSLIACRYEQYGAARVELIATSGKWVVGVDSHGVFDSAAARAAAIPLSEWQILDKKGQEVA